LLSRTLPYDKRNEPAEIAPLDELLQIDRLPFKMTKLVMLEVAYMGQMMTSYSQASIELEKKLGYKISTSLVRDVTIFVGKLVYQKDVDLAVQTEKNMASSQSKLKELKKGIVYILIDGAAVNTRIEDKNGSTWRENKLGMAFVSAHVRKRGSSDKSGHTITKKEYSAYIGSASDFSKFVYQIAINQGYGQYEQTIILGDGAAWIRTMCEDLFPDALQILDFYHLCENVYDFAKYAFKKDEKRYKPWAKKIIRWIREERLDEVFREVGKTGITKTPTGVVNLKGYLINNKDKMSYNRYLLKGYYIGSGAIESANKVILQRRLKQAGMRWSVPTAQAVLSLRAKVESGLWSDVRYLILNL
jgi:hypothetical protein